MVIHSGVIAKPDTERSVAIRRLRNHLSLPPVYFVNSKCTNLSMVRYSGLQREVLKLYRACLRAARTKPEVSGQFR